MSFILEALKKSENERQRTIGPSLADVQVRPRQSEKPWWAIAVGALLVVNLGVLLVVLTRDGDTMQAPAQLAPAVEPSAAPTPNTSIAAMPPPARAAQQGTPPPTDPSVRSLADEANVDGMLEPYAVDNPQLAAAAVVPDGPPIVQPIEGPNVAPAVIRPGVRQQPPAEPAEVLPTVRDLAAGGTQLPELHLDIHVHSPVPAERFVFVNMRKYIEGQTLSEGPTIERITEDGVVLNHQGLRFLLPRQ